MAELSWVMATSSSWLAGGEEALQRQEVVSGSEPPCHADAWLLSLVVSQRQSAPADELSGLVDKLLSLQVSQRQSAPADELSGVVYELLSSSCLRGNPFLLTSSQAL